MKILSITAQKPHSTGSGTYLTELVNAFHRMGHEQAVVAGIYRDDSVEFPAGVEFHPVYFNYDSVDSGKDHSTVAGDGTSDSIDFPVAGMSDVMPYVSTRYCDMTEEMIAQWRDAFLSVIDKVVADFQPDLIYCHHLFLLTAFVGESYTERYKEKYPDIKVCGQCHGSDLRQMMNCTHLQDRVRPAIAGLDHIFALHEQQKETIVKLYGVAPARITPIGSGYNTALFNTIGRKPRVPGSPVRISYAGKLSNAKGVNEFLQALRELLDEGRNLTATLAGGCQEPDILKQLDALPGEIEYVGMVPQAELADIFRTNDIFVLPSYYEGLSLVVIEAMATGQIPISTDLPGLQEWVSAKVPNHNVKYVPMPEMSTVDEPTDAGKANFVRDLKYAIGCAVDEIEAMDRGVLEPVVPDASAISWDGVAGTILEELQQS